MVEASLGLVDRAAFDRHDNVSRAPSEDFNNPFPIEHPVPTRTADRCAGYLAPFRLAMFDGDVLGMEMDEAIEHSFQPGIGVLARQVGIAGVQIDADARGFDQAPDSV